MHVIPVRNVHQALPTALYQLLKDGVERESRNGPVLLFNQPVTTVYYRPAERVIFWPERDANPFFHLIESLWMLAGMNDVETVATYAQNIRNYSDDGMTFHGAYGHRWRHHFGFDQLSKIIDGLKENPDDRRMVLSMWDAKVDLGRKGKDVPCNLTVTFQVNYEGVLEMTVFNRSNDMVWGCYGANAVHFSYLHEFIARSIGRAQGFYRQISVNLHTYKDQLGKVNDLMERFEGGKNNNLAQLDPYAMDRFQPYPLMTIDKDDWLEELSMFFSDPDVMGFRDPFFRRVALPMAQAHKVFKQIDNPKRFQNALDILERVKADDWRRAAVEWIVRREAGYQRKLREARAKDDGVAYE